ncbi:MAG: hypothetical protein Kow00108_13060 [Calditrichia bacterium]
MIVLSGFSTDTKSITQLVKFHVSSKIFVPYKIYLQKSILDTLQVNPEQALAYLNQLDSLDNQHIEIFYRKYLEAVDSTRFPEKIILHIPDRFKITKMEHK